MNKYLKSFLHRGLIFGGFGPIILAVIYFIISKAVEGFSLNGTEILIGMISIYFLAFIQAGASVFNQIEGWSIAKSLLCHFSVLYIVYVLCYVINSWIPFSMYVILIFTLTFAVVYFITWISVFISIKIVKKRLNAKLK